MKLYLVCGLSVALFIASCGREDLQDVIAEGGASVEPFFTSTVPEGAKQIHEARPGIAVDDEITIVGMVMGRSKPFVDGRAAFVLGDRTILTPCNEKEGDECATPWDVCCDSSEDKRRGTATIQLVGDDGRVISQGLHGFHGLKELSAVTVQGRVAEGSDGDVLIVNAKMIHLHP